MLTREGTVSGEKVDTQIIECPQAGQLQLNPGVDLKESRSCDPN
jgi:hypothetical protein